MPNLTAISALQAQSLLVSPSTITFNAVADSSAAPPTQTVQVSASDGSHAPFTVSVPIIPGTQLTPVTASPLSGMTPATVTIGFLPAQEPIADYNTNNHWPYEVGEQLSFASNSSPSAPSATLVVYAYLSQPPPPLITGVVNQASQLPGVSPGELISIVGSFLGPGTEAGGNYCFQPGNEGPPCYYETEAGGTTITLNGVPAPVIAVGPTAANTIVPYTLAGPTMVVAVTHYGQTGATVSVPLAVTSPGIFPDSLTNDDRTQNGPGAPDPAGSDLSFIVTGFGLWNQPGLDPSEYTYPGRTG